MDKSIFLTTFVLVLLLTLTGCGADSGSASPPVTGSQTPDVTEAVPSTQPPEPTSTPLDAEGQEINPATPVPQPTPTPFDGEHAIGAELVGEFSPVGGPVAVLTLPDIEGLSVEGNRVRLGNGSLELYYIPEGTLDEIAPGYLDSIDETINSLTDHGDVELGNRYARSLSAASATQNYTAWLVQTETGIIALTVSIDAPDNAPDSVAIFAEIAATLTYSYS